ncbi:hypothetical protein [Streptomyces sp. NPDC050485]|uniref:hypothetical protein n=1 Tax=Streptomyces sp. NPDC050485 TaxID=3365617 RepID=UPI00378EB8FA
MNRRPGQALATAFVLLGGGLAVAACGHAGASASARPITGPIVLGADGRTLSARITVGGCEEGQLAGAEGDSTVKLTLSLIRHQKSGEVCPAYVKVGDVSLTLRSPLGSRTVVDGTSGNEPAVVRQ